MFDFSHPFYRPLWIRIAITAICFGWAMVEFSSGAAAWGVMFGAVGLYAGWALLVSFDPRSDDVDERKDR